MILYFMDLIEQAYREIFPGMNYNYESSIIYSKAFSDYNANVRYTKTKIMFRLSYMWKGVSKEIQIGLIQSLLVRIFKVKMKTTNMDLYSMFLKNIHIGVPKDNIEPLLKNSFDRVNEQYFAGMIEMPNLMFSGHNFSKLGTYEYGSDTITISKVLIHDMDLLDYVMYHEMLHKKLKFKHDGARSVHHSREFREKEKQWHDKQVEDKLKIFLKAQKRKRWLGF